MSSRRLQEILVASLGVLVPWYFLAYVGTGIAPKVFTKGLSFKQPSISVKVVDTVGAGDTFTAGFLASLQKAGKLNKAAVS